MANNIDTMISKGKGALKGVEARLEGLLGIFKTLAKQHGEASALIDRVKSEAAKRQELWPTLRKELLSHEKSEIKELYPELREHSETSALADQHDGEADELEKVIKRLDVIEIDSDEWGQLFGTLGNMVVRHATEEEQTIFPAAQAVLGDEEAKKLDQRFKATQKRLKESL